MIEARSRVVIAVPERYHPHDERACEQSIHGVVEDRPERQIEPANFVKFAELVENEAKREEIQDDLNNIEITSRIDGVDRSSVQPQIDERYDDLHSILIPRNSHTVRLEMCPVGRIGLLVVADEASRILIVLYKPATPEVRDTLLITGRANDAQSVQVYCLLDCVDRSRVFSIDQDRETSEQDMLEKVRDVFFALDALHC